VRKTSTQEGSDLKKNSFRVSAAKAAETVFPEMRFDILKNVQPSQIHENQSPQDQSDTLRNRHQGWHFISILTFNTKHGYFLMGTVIL
jgi:hypothetical protein